MSDLPPHQVARSYTPTALPPVAARLLAFLAIVLAGACGAVIGYAVTDLQCGPEERASPGAEVADTSKDDDGCATVAGLGALGGAVLGAGGVAVVATLGLRAMAEWRRNLEVSDP